MADELGVRIRLGVQWRGAARGRRSTGCWCSRGEGVLHDGRVIIKLHHVARAIEGLEGRARRHAALNRKMYGAALAVPLGLTTRTTGDHRGDRELCDRIADLAQDRTEVLVLVDDQAPVTLRRSALGGRGRRARGDRRRRRRSRSSEPTTGWTRGEPVTVGSLGRATRPRPSQEAEAPASDRAD